MKCYSKSNYTMQSYRCGVCDWVYDPDVGDPEHNVPVGIPFEELPDDWICPICFAGKEDFDPCER